MSGVAPPARSTPALALRLAIACAVLAAIVAGLVAAEGAAAGSPGVIVVDRARLELSTRPGEPPAQVVLPHLWSRGEGPAGGLVEGTYRLALPASPADRPVGVYVPKLRTNARFEVNGHWIADGGRLEPPVARRANTPFFVAIPPALLREAGNELAIRVVSPGGVTGGLSVVHVGPREALADTVALRRLVQNTGVYLTSAIIAATSLYILLVRAKAGPVAGRGFLALGLAGLVWALRNLNLVLSDFGTTSDAAHRAIEYATFTGHGLFLALYGWFLVERHARLLPRRATRALRAAIPAFVALGPVLLVAFGGPSPALTVWMVASSPLLAAMLWVLVRRARQSRATADALLALLFVAFVAASVYDNTVLMRTALFGRIYVAHYVGLLFFCTIAYLLVDEYVRALRAVGQLNQSLESRLQAREAELRARFEDARALEHERAALEERTRIMRDLHDGVGAQLLTAIHEVESHGADAAAVREVLDACLDDLRLTVDSLEPHDDHLSTILGGLRYRLAPRLARAGLTMRWDVEEVGALPGLDPTRTLHILRILQEAIANVLRHANATSVVVRLARVADGVEIEVRDDGRGFDPELARSHGHGLRNLEQRAAQLGGTLAIRSDETGTRVTLRLPG